MGLAGNHGKRSYLGAPRTVPRNRVCASRNLQFFLVDITCRGPPFFTAKCKKVQLSQLNKRPKLTID